MSIAIACRRAFAVAGARAADRLWGSRCALPVLAIALASPAAADDPPGSLVHLAKFPAAGLIEIEGAPVALDGVAVTPAEAVCGEGVDAWPCGTMARSALQRFVRRRAVACQTMPRDEEIAAATALRTLCRVGGSDIGQWLVSNGWAKADGPRYAEAEAKAKAKEARRGIWAPVRPRPLLAALSAVSDNALAEGVAPSDAAVVAVVTLATQSMTLFHHGEIIGHWEVSTARKGKLTPTGAWRAQWLSRDHRSSLYDDAPMPYSVFFNGDYAVHGTNAVSRLGRPASAGCVRLSTAHAKVLFDLAREEGLDNTVVVIRP